MNGKRIVFKICIFFIIVLCAGLLFLHIREIPLKYEFVALAEQPSTPTQASVLVVGDIMLDRNVRNKIDAKGFDVFFQGVKEIISSADVAVGNLEGPFTPYDSITASLKNKALQFTFDPVLVPKLADLGFDILGLANNHTLNFGLEGLNMTRKYIQDAGMLYYGDPNNSTEISTVIEKNGITIGFVGFHEFTYINYEKVIAEIDRLRPEVDVLIVSPHWGIEYQKEPTNLQEKLSHTFIDHGADVVIGAHPHVIGQTEDYQGKKIFYSLGNFAFDQYFSKETMEGLVVKMIIQKNQNNNVVINYETNLVHIDKNGPIVD